MTFEDEATGKNSEVVGQVHGKSLARRSGQRGCLWLHRGWISML